MSPTNEQLEAVLLVKANELVKIDAVAGSGKSTTLELIAEDNPDRKCLYLAYNKTMQLEAKSIMPSNVECRTTHSIAYQEIGGEYQHKLKRPVGEYHNVAGTGAEIAKFFKIPPIFEKNKCLVSSIMIGQLVKETVAKFEQSSDEKVAKSHISMTSVRIALKLTPASFKHAKNLINRVCETIINFSNKLWAERVKLESKVLITHDTYMKLYQLSKPVLSFDIILLDEAQDANPCFLSIVENNIGKAKIVFVGDKHQAIYGWRGAVNAMQMFDCPTASLSKSFRYGSDIAQLAQLITRKEVVGNDSVKSEVGIVDYSKPYTVLFRTNSGLIDSALELVKEGKTVNIQADVSDLCKLVHSTISLKKGEMKGVKHESLFAFECWNDLKKEVETFSKGDLGRVVSYIENGTATNILKYLSEHVNVDKPDVTLVTAHKSKGLEYEQVVLAEDFPSIYDEKGNYVGLDESETNLLYVAVTRAKTGLVLNRTMNDLISRGSTYKGKGATGFQLNCTIYTVRDYLDNPELQLPRGEMAQIEFDKVIDTYGHSDYYEPEEEGDEVDCFEQREEYGRFMESLTGINPNMMPCLDNLRMESTVLGKYLK